MPVYEYQCDQDGTILELIRPMSRADEPVTDPEGKDRTFHRLLSSVRAGKAAGEKMQPRAGGCCPCGKSPGGCGTR